MKKIIIACLFVSAFFCSLAQETTEPAKAKFPSVDVKTIDGKVFNTGDIANDGKPIIISLWATWCKSCILELMAINDVYEDWVDETGVKVYAISIDDSKTAARVAPFVNGKGWEFEILQDINSDLKRALNIVDIPYLCILNGNGEIVYKHTSYAPGSEEEVYEIVKGLVK